MTDTPSTPEMPRSGSRWRHLKRGSTYTVIGVASAQVVGAPIEEGAEAVVYRADSDGSLWVRPAAEFLDGRFDPLPVASTPEMPEMVPSAQSRAVDALQDEATGWIDRISASIVSAYRDGWDARGLAERSVTPAPSVSALERAEAICSTHESVCGACSGTYPNPDCGHAKNAKDFSQPHPCYPQTDTGLVERVAAAITEAENAACASVTPDADYARKAIKEALYDWWLTRDFNDEPGDDLVAEIMGGITLAKIVKIRLDAAAIRRAALEEAARVADSWATCGCEGQHGHCNTDDIPNGIATDIRSLAGHPASVQPDEQAADFMRKLLDCARYDATMEGPKYRGWNITLLNRLRVECEQVLRPAPETLHD